MLVRDDPASALLAEADGQAQAVFGILAELVLCAAAEQSGGERDIGPGGDVEGLQLEDGSPLSHPKNGGHVPR
jgi:hypothetical protein